MGFRWVLLKLLSQVLHNTCTWCNYIQLHFLSWKRLWVSDLIVQIIIFFQTQKQLVTLNSTGVLLKGVLIDLCAHNFVHAKTSLHAHCIHTRNHACNFSGPGYIRQLLMFICSHSSHFSLAVTVVKTTSF